VGDAIAVDDYQGTVEHIGMKSTRIRSLGGELIIISNSELLTSRIRNYGRMQKRRALFRVRVAYDTPPAKIEQIPGMIREIITAIPKTRFERTHFLEYGEYALIFETEYYVLVPGYTDFAGIQQEVNLGILKKFRAAGIEFALAERPPRARG